MAKVALRYTCTIAPAHMGLVEKELLRHLIQKIKSLNAPSPMVQKHLAPAMSTTNYGISLLAGLASSTSASRRVPLTSQLLKG
jgi:hypothetical protein